MYTADCGVIVVVMVCAVPLIVAVAVTVMLPTIEASVPSKAITITHGSPAAPPPMVLSLQLDVSAGRSQLFVNPTVVLVEIALNSWILRPVALDAAICAIPPFVASTR